MTLEQIETELGHLATNEGLAELKAQLHKDLGTFETDLHRDLGSFKADLIKTLWLTQLSTIGIILVGTGLLVHFKL